MLDGVGRLATVFVPKAGGPGSGYSADAVTPVDPVTEYPATDQNPSSGENPQKQPPRKGTGAYTKAGGQQTDVEPRPVIAIG